MPKLTYVPNEDIMSVLKAQISKPFTVVDIRNGLLKHRIKSGCPNALRRWVNGQFQTLVKHKYIEVIEGKAKKKLFQNTNLTLTFEKDIEQHVSSVGSERVADSTTEALRRRLKECKLELLSFIGETKEYEELSRQYPNIRERLQTRFNLAQEKNIEYVGRVKALESLLAEQLE